MTAAEIIATTAITAKSEVQRWLLVTDKVTDSVDLIHGIVWAAYGHSTTENMRMATETETQSVKGEYYHGGMDDDMSAAAFGIELVCGLCLCRASRSS